MVSLVMCTGALDILYVICVSYMCRDYKDTVRYICIV